MSPTILTGGVVYLSLSGLIDEAIAQPLGGVSFYSIYVVPFLWLYFFFKLRAGSKSWRWEEYLRTLLLIYVVAMANVIGLFIVKVVAMYFALGG